MPNPSASTAILANALPPGAPIRFIGRQPILTATGQVFGYELLFRNGWQNSVSADPESIGQHVIDATLLFGMDNLVFGGKAFINCTGDALTSRCVTCLPVASTVLEILETVAVDNEVIAACNEFKQLGYEIALDDFVPGTSSDRLIEMADYIKLDFQACDAATLHRIRQRLQGSRAALLAEKVETAQQFQRAANEGYRFFQGYFFAHPSVLTSREIPSNRMVYIQLLAALSRTHPDSSEIDRLVSSEASLCFRLLRLVNSASFGARGHVSSIGQALLLVGEAEFRKLVSIVAATSMGSSSNQSPELLLLCLHRARFCELLAPRAGQSPAEQYLIGLLSVLDAMLDMPMRQALKMLPLRPAAASVLLGEPSPIDLPMTVIRHYEQSQWEFCAASCRSLGLSEVDLTCIYLDSLRWADHQIHSCAL